MMNKEESKGSIEIIEKKRRDHVQLSLLVSHSTSTSTLKMLQNELIQKLAKNISMEQSYHSSYNQSSCTFDKDVQMEIINEIHNNDVSIVVGATGSGKSSLLPQLILDKMQNGRYTRIIVTEPRRIAAVSLATSVSKERNWGLGDKCGYVIGGDRKETGMKNTRLLYVTNSICAQILALLGNDNNLPPCTHIILDEIHIRSRYDDLNMSILRNFLANGNTAFLKVIVMSATADVHELSQYFSEKGLKVGIVKLPKPKFKINKYYLHDIPIYEEIQKEWTAEGLSLPEFDLHHHSMSLDAVCHRLTLSHPTGCEEFFQTDRPREVDWLGYFVAKALLFIHENTLGLGRILCFLPGDKEIELVTSWLEWYNEQGTLKPFSARRIVGKQTVESQQHNLNDETAERGRVILLASDVIESCVTPLNLEIVVDCFLQKRVLLDGEPGGTLRHYRLQKQQTTKAEADQRAGRAGRQSDGKVYRLVSKSFFQNLKDFPTPEMKNIGLDDLLLQFCAAQNQSVLSGGGLTEDQIIDTFSDMMNPPPQYAIRESIVVLKEVGALKDSHVGLTVTHILGEFLKSTYMDPRHALLLLNGLRFGRILDCAAIVAISSTKRSMFNIEGNHSWRINDYQHAVNSCRSWYTSGAPSSSDIFAKVKAFFNFHFLRCMAEDALLHNHGQQLPEDWCFNHYISFDAILEVEGHFKEILGRLRQHKWLSPEEEENSLNSCWTLWLLREQKKVWVDSQQGHLATRTTGEKLLNDTMMLNLILFASFPDCLVQQSIEPSTKVPLRHQTNWSRELKCQLRRVRKRRNWRRAKQSIQDDIQKIDNFFGGKAQMRTRSGKFVFAQFSTVEECLDIWHHVRSLPPSILKWNIDLNATYKYQRLHYHSEDTVTFSPHKCFPQGSSFTVPAPVEQRTVFLAIDWVKVASRKESFTELFSDVTRLPLEWSQPHILKALLYAVAPSMIALQNGSADIRMSGRRVFITQTEAVSVFESAKQLRQLLENEDQAVHNGVDFLKTTVDTRIKLAECLFQDIKRIATQKHTFSGDEHMFEEMVRLLPSLRGLMKKV